MPDMTPEEKMKIFEEEKARIESQGKPPAKVRKEIRNIGCGTIFLILFGLFILAVIAVLL
jgi:hypothetical protein